MKKILHKTIVAILSLSFAFGTLVGCSETDNPVGPNSIQISYSLGSFGREWLDEAVKRFNETFADRGYSAVVDRVDAAFNEDSIKNEIKSINDNSYDLYIAISNNIGLVDDSYSILRKRDECLLEDLTDMYNSKVINLDGSEGAETVLETRNAAMLPYHVYNYDNVNFKGKYYGYQWTSAYCGMVMNTKVLKDFGYDHAPRTTMEMKAICDDIVSKNRKSENGNTIRPVVWPGANASGYFAYPLFTWMAQYMGVEDYTDFFKFKPKTGTTIENGYDVYDNEAILYALRAMETFAAREYAAEGSLFTLDHMLADGVLMDGEALFEITGDWSYHEVVGIGYDAEHLSRLEVIPVPIVSELADKIGLTGSAEEKDTKLSEIIKCIDEGKTDNEIIAQIASVTADMVAKVREARGIYYDLGSGHQAFIPSYSDAKDVAKLFLRFISSKEFSNSIYSKNANGITANVSAVSEDTNFLKSLTKVCRQAYSTPIAEAICLSDIRYKGGISYTFEPVPHYGQLARSMAQHTSEYTADECYAKIKNAMKNNWATILATAGYYE